MYTIHWLSFGCGSMFGAGVMVLVWLVVMNLASERKEELHWHQSKASDVKDQTEILTAEAETANKARSATSTS